MYRTTVLRLKKVIDRLVLKSLLNFNTTLEHLTFVSDPDPLVRIGLFFLQIRIGTKSRYENYGSGSMKNRHKIASTSEKFD